MPVAIPLIAAAITAGGTVASTAYAAHSASNEAADARSANAPMLAAQTQLARLQSEQGRKLFGMGAPLIGNAASYYNSILRGGTSGIQRALAPEREQISQTYGGAASGLSRMAPGGVRDQAEADLSRDRAASLSRLVPAARANAAGAVGNLGVALTGQGSANQAGASGIYGNLLGLNQQQQQFDANQSYSTGQGFGKVIADALSSWQAGRGGRNTASASPTGSGKPPANTLGDFTTTPGAGAYA